MSSSSDIIIFYASQALKAKAEILAHKLKAHITSDMNIANKAKIGFYFKPTVAEIKIAKISALPFRIDIEKALTALNKQKLHNHPLIMAIGKKNKNLTIVDTTCGLGKDTVLLGYAGHNITAIEANPIIYTLFHEAILHYTGDIILNINLINTNSVYYLQNIQQKPDIVYLDPMFPSNTKNTLVKKPMQMLQYILANDFNDNISLLEAALLCATKKVIVKRPRKAKPIANIKPQDYISLGESTRYDIYNT